jgi:hypothetical protein
MPFESVTDEIWQADLDLKRFAAIRRSGLVWPGMKERRWGRIINVLNTAAKAPPAAPAPTSVSRAAGMALTKVLAGEGGAHNILVNALLVGLIVSDQWVKRHAATAPDIEFGDFTRNLAKGVPLGRMGTAEEFANLACFLASILVPTLPVRQSTSTAAVRQSSSFFRSIQHNHRMQPRQTSLAIRLRPCWQPKWSLFTCSPHAGLYGRRRLAAGSQCAPGNIVAYATMIMQLSYPN